MQPGDSPKTYTSLCISVITIEPRHKKTCFCHMRTTKVQISLRIRGLISNFVVRFLDSIIPLLAIAGISRPKQVSVTEQAGLSLTWSQTPKTGFLVTWLNYNKETSDNNKRRNYTSVFRLRDTTDIPKTQLVF